MNASASILIVLHERTAPPIAIEAAKRVEVVGLPCADAATTLPGMAKAVLTELRERGLDGACVVVGLGDRAGVFAQALVLEMLGCDLPVAGVAAVYKHREASAQMGFHPVCNFGAKRGEILLAHAAASSALSWEATIST